MSLSTIRKSSSTSRRAPSAENATDDKPGSEGDRARKASGTTRVEKKAKSNPPPPHASMLYRNLTPAYEMVWPLLARRNIWSSIASLGINPGERVLEVGVGTGLSLKAYPAHALVTGVDLSEEMLGLANDRIKESQWSHINVMPMNAEELVFPDASFDVVTSFHVISVVSNPKRMMSEMIRVCRPGGRILIVNHFRSPNRWIAKVVDSAGAFTRHLGWRTDLKFDDVVSEMPLRMDRRYKPSPVSLFTIMSATKLE
jgi:phosphatidylethanolamine/phosphatidyl-N-methylethanolamine N-methyltransferase